MQPEPLCELLALFKSHDGGTGRGSGGEKYETETTQAELSSFWCQWADQRHEKEADRVPKTRAYQGPSVTPEASCRSQLIKGLASYTQTYQLVEWASAPCWEPSASREILGRIETLTPIFYLQWNVDRNRKVPPGALIFFINCLCSNHPLESSRCFTNTIHLTAGHHLSTTSSLGRCVVAEPLPRSKFVTVEWLVLKKHPPDQGIQPSLGGGAVTGKVERARYLGKVLGCLFFFERTTPR